MAKKKISATVEVKERKIEGDSTTLSINIAIPTKLFYIAEVLEESGRIENIEKVFETSIESYFEKIYQIVAPDKPSDEKTKQPSKSKKVINSTEEK